MKAIVELPDGPGGDVLVYPMAGTQEQDLALEKYIREKLRADSPEIRRPA
jgi:hypothetical protein